MKQGLTQHVIFAGKYVEAADYIHEMNYKLGEYRIISKYTMVLGLGRSVKYIPRLVGTWASNPDVKLAYETFMRRFPNGEG